MHLANQYLCHYRHQPHLATWGYPSASLLIKCCFPSSLSKLTTLPAPLGQGGSGRWHHRQWGRKGVGGRSAAQSQASSQPGFVGSKPTFLTKVGITY